MIAFPIPSSEGLPPFVGVLILVVATAGFVVAVVAVVRHFRNSGDGHDVFGPPLDDPRDRTDLPDSRDPNEDPR
jgi:hypothetical protein